MDKIIEVKGLKKSYGQLEAVKGIDFYVERGKLFSFLGPNGAGKSTTIDIICTLLAYDAGEIIIDGHLLGKDDDQIRSIIGAVYQDNVLDPLLSVKDNLRLRAGFYMKGRAVINKAVDEAVEAANVGDFLKRPYGKLSGGQRRRADIARALLNTPKILFLDEPTTGLDPQTRKHVWDTIKKLQEETGVTIFLTTHYMEEAAESDYVIIIDDGKIAAGGTPVDLKEKYARDVLRLSPLEEKEWELRDALVETEYKKVGKEYVVGLKETLDAYPILEKVKPLIQGFSVLNGTMDDVFIKVTGKEMRE